jgi:hypothetical protein
MRCAVLIQSRVIPKQDPKGTYQGGSWARPNPDQTAILIEELIPDAEEWAVLSEAGAWDKRLGQSKELGRTSTGALDKGLTSELVGRWAGFLGLIDSNSFLQRSGLL